MKLGSLFTHYAVLQRNIPVSIWGETLPNTLVRAQIDGNEAYTKSSRGGSFLLRLPPMDAGGPFELTVSLPDVPEESVTLKNILIGDVFLFSGQSNMQYTLGSRRAKELPEDGSEPVCVQQEKEFLNSIRDPETLRFITVPMKGTGCREPYFEGVWQTMTGENAPAASAVAAWFGLKLRDSLNIPIGLICCSWGGSSVETWISPASLKMLPETRDSILRWEELKQKAAPWTSSKETNTDALLREFTSPNRQNKGFELGWAETGWDDSDWGSMTIPGSWINQCIAGNGAVWVRKKIHIPPELAGKDLLLRLGAIDKQDTTYFNGVQIGRSGKDWDLDFFDKPRSYKVPGSLVQAGENTLAVRAYSFAWDGSFMPPENAYSLQGPDFSLPLAGEWKAKAEIDFGIVSFLPFGLDIPNTPGLLFDAMIRPLLPASIRGVVWYQGETNAGNVPRAKSYLAKMETLIRDWRFHFEQPDLPFFHVQLADYMHPADFDPFSSWAILRDVQLKVCRKLPEVYLATALDTGEENDIHPQNKKDVGFRLAASALHHLYGRSDILPCGPEFREAKPEGGALRVFFLHADGMNLRGKPGRSFFLAGENRKFYPADKAEISGDSILLSSEMVKAPRYVRYAWSNNPVSILFNADFPAASFSSEMETLQ